jgi:adenine-specific DNA-methyltransferase
MIKYLGSKRRLVPVLEAICAVADARRALDLFTGTTRVAQAFKRAGAEVVAVDLARYSHVLAGCYVATDAAAIDHAAVADAVADLDRRPGRAGYVTDVFCTEARYFQPDNGARIDAIRDAIAERYTATWLEPILLTSLLEAADRVDSTAGLQMAYLKQWAPRAANPLQLRVPALVPGRGEAIRDDACAVVGTLGRFDLAYLDPPYNQHRYFTNYHVWETLIAWDRPAYYGVACKRADSREPHTRSDFNDRRLLPGALRHCIETVDARVVVVSCSDEGWVTVDEIAEWCRARGEPVRVLPYRQRRYVGAQIGIHDPAGNKVGQVSHVHNVEHLVVAGNIALPSIALDG